MKKNFLSILLLSTIFFFAACDRLKQSNAIIFERKEIDSTRIMIKYAYVIDGKEFKDSAIILNKVLKSDSITIQYSDSSPEKSILLTNE